MKLDASTHSHFRFCTVDIRTKAVKEPVHEEMISRLQKPIPAPETEGVPDSDEEVYH
jgi:hypothetical protein